MDQQFLVQLLADAITIIHTNHPIRVAVDGIDAAGKTTLADNLAMTLQARSRHVIRASIDDFQRPRADRYRQGPASPQGYYEDAFDIAALRDVLLQPLGPGGNRRYRTAVFDIHTDTPVVAPAAVAPDDVVLVCDGVFLLRPELADLWEYRIFVRVDFAVGLRRALLRDATRFGSAQATWARYLQRYYPAQRRYLDIVHPERHADAIVDNDDVLHPRLRFPQVG